MGSRYYVGVGAIVGLVCLGLALRSRIVFWNIPDNFRGWVTVTFDVPNCNQQSHLFWTTVPIDQTGRGCSRFPFQGGWTVNRYAYIKADGSHTTLSSDGGTAVSALPLGYSSKYKTYEFFVGTEAERDKSWQSSPKP